MYTKIKMIAYWATTAFVALETNAAGVTDRVHGGTRLVGSNLHMVGAPRRMITSAA